MRASGLAATHQSSSQSQRASAIPSAYAHSLDDLLISRAISSLSRVEAAGRGIRSYKQLAVVL